MRKNRAIRDATKNWRCEACLHTLDRATHGARRQCCMNSSVNGCKCAGPNTGPELINEHISDWDVKQTPPCSSCRQESWRQRAWPSLHHHPSCTWPCHQSTPVWSSHLQSAQHHQCHYSSSVLLAAESRLQLLIFTAKTGRSQLHPLASSLRRLEDCSYILYSSSLR